MAQLSTVLQPFWMRNLNAIGERQDRTVKMWIADGALTFDHMSPSGAWVFNAPDVSALMRGVACDVNRTAAAAFESVAGIPSSTELPRSTAWSLIRLYYAAFFAAHSLMRVHGIAVLQLERSQVSVLNGAMRLVGHATSLPEGLVSMTVDQGNRTFELASLTKGSHIDTWSIFAAKIKELSDAATTSGLGSQVQRQEAIEVLGEISGIMSTAPAQKTSNWLSYMRNQLNYQHTHGAWYPHERSSRFRAELSEAIEGWKSQPSIELPKSAHTLVRFGVCCAAIVAWARETSLRVASRHPTGESFLRYGALRVLDQCLNRPPPA
ncbi:hypothetical protein [Caballeronia sp. LZ001]|uniref:hypothetical protein n=1 Tax=Caballeronia sp. LZ001 TaxID=3038553 RepID=UPI0028672A34|nr:hypothetical protein [Caballeronia sp. LZ001]MDR5803485.1 hypothetical protein [Caballeronia sp. LZ001]